jgi:hypothetical protein
MDRMLGVFRLFFGGQPSSDCSLNKAVDRDAAGTRFRQRVAAQRPDGRVERGLVRQLFGEEVAGDALRGVEGAAGQQRLRRAGAGLTLPEPVQRQLQGHGHRPAVARLRPLFTVEGCPARLKALQVVGEEAAGLAHEGGGLGQRQRQVAQGLGQPTRLSRVPHLQPQLQRLDGARPRQGPDLDRLGERGPVGVAGGDEHVAGVPPRHVGLDVLAALGIVEDQQPAACLRGAEPAEDGSGAGALVGIARLGQS